MKPTYTPGEQNVQILTIEKGGINYYHWALKSYETEKTCYDSTSFIYQAASRFLAGQIKPEL